MTECPAQGDLVEIEIDRIATQYREAQRLIGYMRAVFGEVEDAARAGCAIPENFDILNAVGEQLTFIGKRMGFPRCHCICVPTPVLGFSCEGVDEPIPIAGACEEATWLSCHDGGAGDLCIYDDEAYRAHLLARRYQMLGLFDWASLREAIQTVWGASSFPLGVLFPQRNAPDCQSLFEFCLPRPALKFLCGWARDSSPGSELDGPALVSTHRCFARSRSTLTPAIKDD